MAGENKKKILVIGDSEMNYALDDINRGLKKYQLVSISAELEDRKKIVERMLFQGRYDGVLIDELYEEFVPIIRQSGKKYGMLKYQPTSYGGIRKVILEENKTVKISSGFPTPEEQLDAIFS